MRLLDLYCGAGGAAVGYHRAGFDEIVGVDNKPQKHYPFEFIQADVIEYLNAEIQYSLDSSDDLSISLPFDLIHASPPCQSFSVLNNFRKIEYPNMIKPTRELLKTIGIRYIIENVVGAPLIDPVQICGGYFGLGANGHYLKRHRLFESNIRLKGTPCNHFEKYAIGIHGGGVWNNNEKKAKRGGYQGSKEESMEAMDIYWMNRRELAQAIPPAYTEYLGKQVMCYHDRDARKD